MSKIFTEEEKVEIAKQQYENLKLEAEITTESGKLVGYVSQRSMGETI